MSSRRFCARKRHWTATQFSYIASAFQVGMLVGQVPCREYLWTRWGRASDWPLSWLSGPLWGLGHALAASLLAFIVLRFFMGIAQCGNYTAGIKAIAGLFPSNIRSLAGGVFNAGAPVGGCDCPAGGCLPGSSRGLADGVCCACVRGTHLAGAVARNISRQKQNDAVGYRSERRACQSHSAAFSETAK